MVLVEDAPAPAPGHGGDQGAGRAVGAAGHGGTGGAGALPGPARGRSGDRPGRGIPAAAARDAGKVKSVLAELGVSAPETLVADVADEASLARMASRTRVVLNLVG